ncbi:hypothetical protein [Streptomyces sp. H34-S4]|nr:hypothetical protein [Streptomyces sp. H34-S4]MCY0939377.1 hypothetical protein [Streptomyces sp. H34-S4]
MTSNNVTEAELVEPSEAPPSKSVDNRLLTSWSAGLRPRACS